MQVSVGSSWALGKSTGFSLLGARAWCLRLEGLSGLSNLLVKLFVLADVRNTQELGYINQQLPSPFILSFFPLSWSGFIYRLFLASLQEISAKLGQPLVTLHQSRTGQSDGRALPCRSPCHGTVQQLASFPSGASKKWEAKPEQTGGAVSIACGEARHASCRCHGQQP